MIGQYEHLRAPDMIEKAVGFRVWSVDKEGTLMSPYVGRYLWSRTACADCEYRLLKEQYEARPHRAPVVDCTCGLYAWSDVEDLRYRSGAAGIVSFWGDVCVHETGVRAEFMQVEALLYKKPKSYERGPSRDQLELISRKYDVPIVAYKHARDAAEEFGSFVPDILIPKSTGESAYRQMHKYKKKHSLTRRIFIRKNGIR